MSEFLKKYWSQILMAIIIVGGFIYFQKALVEKNGQLYTADSVKQINKTLYEATALEYKTLAEAMADLQKKNDSLFTELKKKNEQPRSVTQITLKLPDDFVQRTDSSYKPIVVHDTILVPIGKDSVQIHENYAGVVDIDGATYLYPYKGYT